MKTLFFFIIILILFLGGCYFYNNYLTKSKSETALPVHKVLPVFPKASIEEPKINDDSKTQTDSYKGIRNWRSIKKVQNLSNQHNKDLENNL